MSGPVKSVSKAVKRGVQSIGQRTGLIPEIPRPDTAALDRASAEAAAARTEAMKQQELLRSEQEQTRLRLEGEQRDLAQQGSARRRAARRGGLRALLSDERLNPDPTRLGG